MPSRRFLFLIIVGGFTACKAPQVKRPIVSITQTTVGHINGVPVAVGGIYREGGRRVVDLTVNRVLQAGKGAGDVVAMGNAQWKVLRIRRWLFWQRGEVELVKE